LNKQIEIEADFVKPFLLGKDVKRYKLLKPNNVVIFPYLIDKQHPQLMSQKYIKENYPLGWDYLMQNKKALEDREKGRMKGNNFYAYIYPKNLIEFEVVKVMTPDISSRPNLTFDASGKLYHTTTIYSFVFKESERKDSKYFLALLNSSLMWFFLKETGNVLRGGYFRFKTEYLKPFPIPDLDLNQQKIKPYITK